MSIRLNRSARRSTSVTIGALLITALAELSGTGILDEARAEYWVDGPDSVQPGSDRSFPDVAVGRDGVAVHVWEAFTNNRNDIFVRRFDRDQVPLGPPLLVNSLTFDDQRTPRISMRDDGGFYVVWRSDEFDADLGTNRDWVRGQLFDAGGIPVGSELLISEVSSGTSGGIQTSVAALDDGSFVAAWGSFRGFGPDSQPCSPIATPGCQTASVQARRISVAGAPLGGQFQVNQDVSSTQSHPSVVATDDGGFVVFWQSFSRDDEDPSSGSIQGRRFDPDGNPLGDDFQVNTTTAGSQDSPEAARDDEGRILVVYESPNFDSSATGVRARLYDRDLNPLNNDDLRIPGLETDQDQYDPRVAGGLGFFMVAWTVFGGIGSDEDFAVNARVLRSTGQFDSPQLQVNQYEPGSQTAQAIGAQGADAVVSWRSNPNAFEADDGIIARSYRFSRLFADGFEE